MGHQLNERFLCMYRDEAIGAKPVPLQVICGQSNIHVSSDYFAHRGVAVTVDVDGNNRIVGVGLGEEISVDLASLRQGMRILPFGLFPAHVLRLDAGFSEETGGVVRFGFLKRMISLNVLWIALKRLVVRAIGARRFRDFDSADIDFWAGQFGAANWGTYDVSIRKDRDGQWRLYSQSGQEPANSPVRDLVAKFDVNQAGIALGIDGMYAVTEGRSERSAARKPVSIHARSPLGDMNILDVSVGGIGVRADGMTFDMGKPVNLTFTAGDGSEFAMKVVSVWSREGVQPTDGNYRGGFRIVEVSPGWEEFVSRL